MVVILIPKAEIMGNDEIKYHLHLLSVALLEYEDRYECTPIPGNLMAVAKMLTELGIKYAVKATSEDAT